MQDCVKIMTFMLHVCFDFKRDLNDFPRGLSWLLYGS
jgi:hypothetical protein